MSRKDWTAPAPLEVERPRLPWWLMLPGKALFVAAPVIAAYVLVRVLDFTARRVWRYPVTLVAVAAAMWFGLTASWWWVAGAVALVAVVGGVWRWRWPDSFDRIVRRQIASEWRRAWVYGRVWRRTTRFANLVRKAGSTHYYPRVRMVRADGWRDRVGVRLLHGQSPDEFTARADSLAHSFGAVSCRVRQDKPRRIWLDFIHSDPLRDPIAPPALVGLGAGIDLRKVPVGVVETGRPWNVRLQGNHVLVVGSTGAGKSSIMWSLLWHLAPAIGAGLVQVFGIDPKGGMELGRAPHLFERLVFDNGPNAVDLLEHVAALGRSRADQLRQAGASAWTPAARSPFVLLVVDELADVVAYQTDRALKTRANNALQTIASQGRAPGVCVLGQVQDPRKSVVDFRHLFPTKIALRLDEPDQVDLALGENARTRGAAAHEISEDTPGVAWTITDGRKDIQRARAFHLTDSHLAELNAFMRTARPTPLTLAPSVGPTGPAESFDPPALGEAA
ncbi:FtsK/SpoIIIE domain-containing protein [Pseudonocardia sp. N23]|uniref:FtsK/SpoIIIE domain-containing protein n=1 Tax=Pseudonocardia sp. N23 TaxID=1987376 RepID=UPI000BFE6203|nr:FtsK/SpoIIIE domain-containing protein [Pseudonocardia sp. N23]GAY12623.1 transfer protein traSA [Pseudonocardia sp. N23]